MTGFPEDLMSFDSLVDSVHGTTLLKVMSIEEGKPVRAMIVWDDHQLVCRQVLLNQEYLEKIPGPSKWVHTVNSRPWRRGGSGEATGGVPAPADSGQ